MILFYNKIFVIAVLIGSMTSSNIIAAPVLISQTEQANLILSETPLLDGAVDITLQHPTPFKELNEKQFSEIWKLRNIAEKHFAKNKIENRLCYSKITPEAAAKWQVVPYKSLPLYLDNVIFRKIYSIWQQLQVLYHTVFTPKSPTEKNRQIQQRFWEDLGEDLSISEGKTGSGALISSEVIQKQLIYPQYPGGNENQILLMYNYAPLKTGGEQMHFILVPVPEKPARDFLELDKEQYLKTLSLAQKISQWAQKKFEGKAVVHFFDKTGKIAGQTQALFHAHVIVVQEEKEELWGKLSMFFRMLLPPSPLSAPLLKSRVQHYKETLGPYLAKED